MRQRWERGRGGSERQAGQKREQNRFKLESDSLAWPHQWQEENRRKKNEKKRGLSCNRGMICLSLGAAHLL